MGVTSLYQRSLTNFVNTMTNFLSLEHGHLIFRCLRHRLFSLEQSLHVPHSLLLVDSFSAFLSLKFFKSDYILRYLHFCSLINIQFSDQLVSSS